MSAPLRRLDEAIAATMAEVRSAPEAIPPRVALFQLACLAGDWERARTQADIVANLDSAVVQPMLVYSRLVAAEATRRRVFAGTEQPVALGEPTLWLAMLAQALQLDGQGNTEGARRLREQARQEAAAIAGKIGDDEFAWVMDADPRLGPVLEVVVGGRYRWLPVERLRELRAAPPNVVWNLVWQPASIRLADVGDVNVFVPVRYPGSELADDEGVRLARETRWLDHEGEQRGLGQRMLATDRGDYPFLDIRVLQLFGGGRDG